MKKIIPTLVFVLLSAVTFSQGHISPAYTTRKSQAIKINVSSLYHSGPTPLVIQNPTFSKAHVQPPQSAYSDLGRTNIGNTLFGRLTGMAVGIGVTYPAGDDSYRPTFREVATGTVVGAAAGMAVGLVAGIIKPAKRKKSNAL